jgi:hypothetical protein
MPNRKYANSDNPIDQAAIFHSQRKEGRSTRLLPQIDVRNGITFYLLVVKGKGCRSWQPLQVLNWLR